MDNYHTPVLLQTACDYLSVKPGSFYIDCTLGGGGHTKEILERGGDVLAIDQDIDAISNMQNQKGLLVKKANFAYLKDLLKELKISTPVAGILVDLGVSSHQFNTPSRGFSIQSEGPLDMRMDTDLPNSAATLVNTLPEAQLVTILSKYGEVSNAKSIAKSIVNNRPLNTTFDLMKLLPHAQAGRKVFQAFRIAVNDELGALDSLLDSVNSILASKGRFVAISFHSLEDKLIKDSFQSWEKNGLGEILTPGPISPTDLEVRINPRSHSAKLRAYQKI